MGIKGILHTEAASALLSEQRLDVSGVRYPFIFMESASRSAHGVKENPKPVWYQSGGGDPIALHAVRTSRCGIHGKQSNPAHRGRLSAAREQA